jgi:hypothetical protein
MNIFVFGVGERAGATAAAAGSAAAAEDPDIVATKNNSWNARHREP